LLTQIVITFATLINEKQVFLESDGGGRGGQGEKKYQNAAEVAAGAVRPLILLVPAGHLSSWGGQWRVGALPWVFHSVFIHSRGIHAVFIPVARTVLRRFQGVLVAADEVCPGREKNLEVGGLGSHDTAQYTGAGHERIRGNHNEASQPTHKS
jgi:hypothetical protein